MRPDVSWRHEAFERKVRKLTEVEEALARLLGAKFTGPTPIWSRNKPSEAKQALI